MVSLRPVYHVFFFSSRRRHTISLCDWSSDVCSSDLNALNVTIEFRIAGDSEFDCDVQRVGAERISGEYRRDTTAVWTDSLPAGAFYSRESAGWHEHRAVLQL